MPTINDDQTFYVRSALGRCLVHMHQEYDQITKYLESEEKVPGIIRDQLEGLLAYNRQFMHEAKKAFRTLPKELKPSDDVLVEVSYGR